MTPSPPNPFPGVHRHVLKASSAIHRIHDARFDANAFNPGIGSRTRFAPLRPATGTPIPHLYGAHGYECAAHETVFHEIQYDAVHKAVAKSKIDPLMLSSLRLRRDLSLASLFQPDLHAWRIERSQLIDTFATAYADTVEWALAIHAAHRVDGLIWTSRRCDPATALILFGDRVSPDDFDVLSSDRITASNDLLDQLLQFGARADITITL
ncbi:MAG: RES family NAD+ phosphorylase [Deltaproteobacteria bacterium]|nr:RES family NAD+ phosphorylase [Deltaproteobacteria bacterium]